MFIDGELGHESSPGKYEDNQINGAEDASEAYDLRYHRNWSCTFGNGKTNGPHGIVTKFRRDPKTAKQSRLYGDPIIQKDGATTCVIQPKTLVTTCEGMRSYFEWYNFCCPLDCVTLLKFIKEEKETDVTRTLLDPDIHCVTDWPQWAVDQLLNLLKRGVSLSGAAGTVQSMLKKRIGTQSTGIHRASTERNQLKKGGAQGSCHCKPNK